MSMEEWLMEWAEEEVEEGRQKGLREGRQKGLQEGRQEGQNRLLKLMNSMVEAGEAEQLPRLSREPAFLQEMLKKYQL